MGPHVLQSRVSGQDYFRFSNTLSCPLTYEYVFSRGFIRMMLRHCSLKMCQGLSNNCPGSWIGSGREAPANGPHAHLTLIACESTAQAAERNCVAEFSNLQLG
jgi:hypothetical protein